MLFRSLAVFGAFGSDDFNRGESQQLRGIEDVNCRIEVFAGGHSWAPKETILRALDWVEFQIITKAAQLPRDARKDACRWYAVNQLQRLRQTEAAFARYEMVERLQLAVRNGALQTDPALAKHLPAVKELEARLKREPEVASNLAARRAYREVVEDERELNEDLERDDIRFRVKLGRREKHAVTELSQDYQAVAAKYADTKYGRLAAVAAASLPREFPGN